MSDDNLAPLPRRNADFAPFGVGDFRVHPSLNQVTGGGDVVRLQPRIMHTLVCLASRAGEVVSRDELLATVWTDSVVCEDSVTRAISDLRRIFADDPARPSYIETIVKGGYRLLLPVEPLPSGRKRTSGGRWWAIAAVLALVLSVLAGRYLLPGRDPAPVTFLTGRPLTSLPGNEYMPALSPDGTRVAFARNEQATGRRDIYVQEIGHETPRRLTDHPADERQPAWSPDGQTLAFVRDGDGTGIFGIDPDGGEARRLCTVAADCWGLDWAPDGRSITFAANDSPGGRAIIQSLDLATGKIRALTSRRGEFSCDFNPAHSPDGRLVAFVRTSATHDQDVWLVPATGGEARPLTRLQRQVDGVDWLPDGRSLVLSAAPTGRFGLWRVEVESGALDWLPTQSRYARSPTLSLGGERLAFVDQAFEADIWQARLDSENGPDDALEPVIDSTRHDFDAVFSPDGRSIAFVSDRSGHREIWLCAADGSAPRQLTHLGGPFVMGPHWAPDGRQLSCTVMLDSFTDIGIVAVADGDIRRLGKSDRHEMALDWTADGNGFYFESLERDRWRLCRMDRDGRSSTVVTPGGYQLVGEAPGGDVYYCRCDEPGVWRIPATGGAEEGVVSTDESRGWSSLLLAGDSILFIERTARGRRLGRYDLTGGRTEYLMSLPSAPGSRLSLHPDGDRVLFARVARNDRDLVLVENFR